MRKKFVALFVALSAATTLAACGSGNGNGHDGHAGSSPTSTIAEDEDFNQADVAFATDMIQHHAQAMSMVDLVDGREVSTGLRTLAEQIRMAQGPEINVLVGWLTDWALPIPETMRDHANAHGDGDMAMDPDMPGMMSAEDMKALGETQGRDFERVWLEMMIEHHQGAVEMAETERGNGKFVDAIDLANTIITAQGAEIDQMKSMLGS